MIPPAVFERYAALRRSTDGALGDAALAAELIAGMRPGAEARSVVVDGHVARWRDADEPVLFAALQRIHHGDALWRAAAEARLLVAPLRERPRPGLRAVRAELRAARPRPDGALRVVDWTSLWAGPWASAMLAAGADEVVRIEHPRRRGDGRWDGAKRLLIADAATDAGHAQVARELANADVIVDGHTARVLPQLGFDAAWLERNAPDALVIGLRAYEPPFDDAPGLGEHASAVAGLLREHDVPLPWADPLLGALVLRTAQRWRRDGRRPGRITLSLEAVAASAFRPEQADRPAVAQSSGFGVSPL